MAGEGQRMSLILGLFLVIIADFGLLSYFCIGFRPRQGMVRSGWRFLDTLDWILHVLIRAPNPLDSCCHCYFMFINTVAGPGRHYFFQHRPAACNL